MVSPYLERPIRTLEQALQDRAWVRNRLKTGTQNVRTGRIYHTPPVQAITGLLAYLRLVQPTASRPLLEPPHDREAA